MTDSTVMVDSIGSTASRIPTTTPKVAGYITGGPGIEWDAADFARFHGAKIPIDQSDNTDPLPAVKHLVKDIEPGASSNATAIAQLHARHHLGLDTTLYTFAANYPILRQQVADAGLATIPFYFIANWNLSQAEAAALLGGQLVAIQFASPTSNPTTLLPGSHLTLAQANCDLSVTLSDWFPIPTSTPATKPPAVKPHPKVIAGGLAAAVTTAITTAVHAHGVHLTTVETGTLTALAGLVAGYLKAA